MKNRKRRAYKIFALAIVLSMVASMLPVTGLAAENQSVEMVQVEQSETLLDDTVYTSKTGLLYKIDNSSQAIITGYTGASGSAITIPSEINGYPVVSIQKEAFLNNTTLTSVVMEDGLKEIGDKAFEGCTNLKFIQLPNTLEKIYKFAFKNTKLSSIELPESLTYIDNNFLYGVEGVTSIIIPKKVTYMGMHTFYIGENLLGALAGSYIKHVKFESGITTIPQYACCDMAYLESVEIPDTVTEIQSWAFQNAVNLTSINLPDDIVTIGNEILVNTGLTELTLPKNVVSVGNGILRDTEGVKKITVPKKVTYFGGLGALCDSYVEEVAFADGIKVIPSHACEGAAHLTTINIPASVTQINNDAFKRCTALTSCVIPDTVTSMGTNAFAYCSSLKNIILPATITRLSGQIFKDCSSLETISIPNTVTRIDGRTFQNCTSLQSVNIGSSVEEIGEYAFEGCSELETVELPESLQRMYAGIFKTCTNLKSIKIPDSVMRFEGNMFYDCDSLTDVSLGSGITQIPDSAFYSCDSLVDIVIPEKVTAIKDNAFKNDVSLRTITIPQATTEIADNVFSYPSKMTIYGEEGSYAQVYANENDIAFVLQKKEVSKVSGLKIGGRAADALRLNWNKNADAAGYIIEQYKNGQWIRIARIGTNSTTTYRVDKLAASTTYKFRIRAFDFDGNTPVYSEDTYINGNTNPSTVTGLKIGGTAKDALRLNWNKNTSASGYIIEQYQKGSWKRIKKIESNSTTTCRVEKLSAGTTYKFRVQAYGFDGSTPLYSSYQSVSGTTDAAVVTPSAVTGLKIGGRATDALRLNWDKNSNASGYIVEQYKNGSWTRIARIGSSSTTTYRVEGLSDSTTYQFRVKAFGFNGSTPVYSTYKNISGTTLPSAVTGLKIGGTAKDALRLNWNKNSKASGYIIEQLKDGKWTRIVKISSNATTTYRVEKLASNTAYVFRVQTYGFDGSTPLYSTYQYISGNTK